MFESKTRIAYVNEYGYPQVEHYAQLESFMTRHLYRGSAMETDDSCGNCDGGRCEDCVEMWAVKECHLEQGEDYDTEKLDKVWLFRTFEEAKAKFDEL